MIKLNLTLFLFVFSCLNLNAQINQQWRATVMDSLNQALSASDLLHLDTTGQIIAFYYSNLNSFFLEDRSIPANAIFPSEFMADNLDSLNANYDYEIFNFGTNIGPTIFPSPGVWSPIHLAGEPPTRWYFLNDLYGPFMTFGPPFDTVFTQKIKPIFGGEPLSALAVHPNGNPVAHGIWILGNSKGEKDFRGDENGQTIIPSTALTDISWLWFSPPGPSFNYITTLDLIKIQKHIVGIEPFTDPYQLLAADANRSKSVTVGDIIRLRKRLLGIGRISDNPYWYVIDADYEFSNPKEPWRDKWPNQIPFTSEDAHTKEPRVVVVLLGDIN